MVQGREILYVTHLNGGGLEGGRVVDVDLDLVLACHHGAAGASVAQGNSGQAESTLAVAELGGDFLLAQK